MDAAETGKARMASLIQDVEKSYDDELQQLVHTLPKEEGWVSGSIYLYQGFWCPSLALKPMISFQRHFQAFDSDVIVATFPKCGTTWLKALTFSTLYRDRFARDEHPLLASTPHQLVRHLEFDVYINNPCPDLENICVYKPRLLATHLRDENQESLSLDKVFDKFCRGIHSIGPFFDHVLEYWNASQQYPDKILFIKYEDLKEDINSQLKHLAMFLGVPFTEDEEKQGVVEEITNICSFEELKELQVNKKGVSIVGIPNKDFFRKAEVGDWSNYLTPSMVERLEKLMHEKLDNSGLTFKLSPKIAQDENVGFA
ncbi:hypothetical protein V6N13_050401 [Hibiscus sabdariffa]